MGKSRYRIYDPQQPHFFTCTILHWIPVFTRPATVEIVLNSLRYLQEDGLSVYAWVILENHLHLIAQSKQIGEDIARFKSFTARELIKHLEQQKVTRLLEQFSYYKKLHKHDRKYQVWQEGSHPQQIQNSMMMNQKVEYIHQNPVKRGYVDQAEHWCYSSARHYAGLPSLLEIAQY